ncbi:MAG TPA: SUF system NifU family Fe-S cluster assembly protein [Fimbriimonadaceae bacterium]|nr:SUF system NifU family Fe-S cluster assembly protein [Fimbriimonadaceae bacterium]
MNDLLRELYQEIILDHNKSPRNRGTVEHPTCEAHGHNPLCGDQVHLGLRVSDGKIEDIKFEGQGCAISVASASLMTEAVVGKSVEEALVLSDEFQSMVTGKDLDKHFSDELEALAGVREFPARVKCATLAWHALEEALQGKDGCQNA